MRAATWGIALAALLWGAQPVAAQDTPMTLSLQSAALFALEESPKVDIAGEQQIQAGEAVNEAESIYYPQIEVSAGIGKTYNRPGVYDIDENSREPNFTNGADMRFALRQMIYDGPGLAEIERRKQAYTATEISSTVTQQNILNDTIKAYLDIYRYQSDMRNAADFLDALSGHTDRLSKAVEAGAESEAKLKYATARLDLARTKLANAQASYNEAVQRMQVLTGPLPAFVVQRPGELDLSAYDLHFLQTMAKIENPELQLAQADIETGALDVKRQKREYLPKVNFVLEDYREQNFGATREEDGRAMVRMTYNVFDGFGREASARRLESRVRELEYQKQDLWRETKTRLATLYNEIYADLDKIRIKESEVASYTALQEINAQALDQGDLDIFEVIDNEERLNTARSELNKLDVDIYAKSYDIMREIGALKKKRFCESC